MRSLEEIDWPRRAGRVRLRRAGPEDVDATWAFRRLPEVGRWLTSAATDKEDYTARFLHPERLAKALVIELGGADDRAVIGDLMVAVGDAWAQAEVEDRARGVQAELGWCLDPRFTGQGYATEAVGALLPLCFDDLGLRRVTASCFADNTASWRLMERLGMRREAHTVRESLHRSGRWLDGYGYALLAEEWRAGTSRPRAGA